MMVAIPELDGATGPMVFGGRSTRRHACTAARAARSDDVAAHARCIERADMLAARVGKLVALRRTRARRAQGRDRAVQLPAERRQHRHRGLSVGVRVAAQHAARA